jgi:hypothetical protein
MNQIAECVDVLSLLYHRQKKHVPCYHNMKPEKKVTNGRASEYDISVAIPFSVGTVNKPQHK